MVTDGEKWGGVKWNVRTRYIVGNEFSFEGLKATLSEIYIHDKK
jgi:hypothetical protein